jgi:hypothetical protein
MFNNMKKYLLFIFTTILISLEAQPPTKFYTKFGGYGHDIGYGVIQTLNGQYAVTGSTSSFGNGNTDVYLALVDSMGWVRWEKSYGGFNNDIGRSIIQLQDSGFVIAGYTNSLGNGGYDVFVVRTDKNGTLIWQKAYGGLDWDFGYCVKATPTGDSLVVCGSTYSYGYGKMDGYVIKLDPTGNLVWQKTYGGAEDDEFKSFVMTYNNMYAFAGTTKSMGDVKGDAWLFKTEINGDSILSKTYGNANKKQFFNDIAEHPVSKNLLFCGGWDVNGTDTIYAYILFSDEFGNLQNEVKDSYKTLKSEEFYAVTYGNKNNDFAYVRRQPNSSSDPKLEAMIMMLNPIYLSSSVTNSINKYGSTEDDELLDIANTRDKGFICVGYTKSFNANLTDVFIVKLDSMMAQASSAVDINEEFSELKEEFSVFPVITASELFIKGDFLENKEIKIEVYSSLGTNLFSKIGKSIDRLDVSFLPEGVYHILISSQYRTSAFKIIKIN